VSIFFDLHSDMPREGPGDDATTSHVWSLIAPHLPPAPEILDVGCGPGAQSIVLARASGGRVTATDVHEPFLREVEARAQRAGVADRVRVVRTPMQALPFADASFDVVWSEGAAWIMGFAAALEAWRQLVKPGGFLVVSELSWVSDAPDATASAFWDEAYPAMRDVAGNRQAIAAAGLDIVADVVLPRAAWFGGYLEPLARRAEALAAAHRDDAATVRWLAEQRREVEIARDCDGFEYVFYVARAPELRASS